ncbi:hypothetical protein ScPMuIL_006034, partial [Solemya velum]
NVSVLDPTDYYTNCTNDYCISDDDYRDMIENFIYPETSEWVLIVVYSITFLVGVSGNFLVCFALWRNRTMRTVTNIFIVNLALSDLTIILVCLPPTLVADVTESWFMGQVMCKIVLYLMNVSVSVSVLTLGAISVERWYAICHPLQFKSTVHRARVIMIIIWLVAGCLAVPELVVGDIIRAVPAHITHLLISCRPGWDRNSQACYQFVLIAVLYVIPLVLMAWMYAQIVVVLRRKDIPGATMTSTRPMIGGKIFTREEQIVSRNKAARMLITVVVVFAVCHFPVHLFNILRYTGALNDGNGKAISIMALIVHWLPYYNSSINPVIYNFMSAKFRKEFRRACFCCVRHFRNRRIRSRSGTFNTQYSNSIYSQYNSHTEALTLSSIRR